MLPLRFPWGFYPLECRRRTYLWWFFLPIPKGLATTGYYLRYHLTNSISRSSYLNSFLVIWRKYFWEYSNVNEYNLLSCLPFITIQIFAMQPVYIIHEQCVNEWFPLFRDELVFCNLYHDKKKTEQFCCDKSVDRDEMINIIKIYEICFTFCWELLIVWQVINTWTTRGVCV